MIIFLGDASADIPLVLQGRKLECSFTREKTGEKRRWGRRVESSRWREWRRGDWEQREAGRESEGNGDDDYWLWSGETETEGREEGRENGSSGCCHNGGDD